MNIRLVLLVLLSICCTCVQAEEVAVAQPKHHELSFKADRVDEYVYQTKQSTKQTINNDKLVINSEIAWVFSLRCKSSNEQNATLLLTIQAIKASVKGPAFEHSIASDDPESSRDTPVIGHLLILNGKSLTLTYDYQTQRLSKLSGATEIHKAFEKIYKPHPITEEPDPRMAGIRAQYSNEALLRLWSEIIRPAGTGTDEISLPAPLNLTLKRKWASNDKAETYAYLYKPTEGQTGPTIQLNPGSNPIEAKLQRLQGSGQIRVVDGTLLEATGSNSATMSMRALTQSINQTLEVNWQLLRTKAYEGD